MPKIKPIKSKGAFQNPGADQKHPSLLNANRAYQPQRPNLGNPADPIEPPEPQAKHRRLGLKKAIAWILLIILAFFIFIGAWDAVNLSHASKKMFGSGNLFGLITSNSLTTDQSGRVNILLVGYSVDDPGHPGADLTDSIMLLSLKRSNHSGYMLSIPRDLYVNIPGNGYAKINEAYQDGNLQEFSESGYPAGGMGLLEKVVAQNFQVSIGYYALVNYAAVRETVNALGDVNINIQSSDPRGLYDPNINVTDGGPLKLSNGWQTIDGQTALNLVRARGDAYNSYGFAQADFDRTTHQRQVLVAIKNKLNTKLILNPYKNGQIFNALASNVKTDMALGDVRPLYSLFKSVPNASLQSLSLRDLNGQNYLTNYTTYSGQSALIPSAGLNDYSQIDAAINQL